MSYIVVEQVINLQREHDLILNHENIPLIHGIALHSIFSDEEDAIEFSKKMNRKYKRKYRSDFPIFEIGEK